MWDSFCDGTEEDSSSFKINYDVSLNEGTKTSHYIITSNISGSYSLLGKFSGAQAIDIYIKSVQYEPKDGYTITIYNTNNDVNPGLIEEQRYQSFYAEVFHLHTYFAGGKGTTSSPNLISNTRHLENIRETAELNVNYLLTDSIAKYSSSQISWEPISIFRGHLNGNNYYIYNLNYTKKAPTTNNIGLFGINYGVIENLTVLASWSVSEVSDINIGAVAGVNHGTIKNCVTGSNSNQPGWNCYAKGDSYMGGITGFNSGTITNCQANSWFQGGCNIGGIAGKNSGTIQGCKVGGYSHKITFNYYDYNACVGGVVGLQTSGSVKNCSYEGTIMSLNYFSNVYKKQSEDRTMQLCVGIIIGRKQGGTTSGNSWSSAYDSIVTSVDGPYVVTWTTGWWLWEETRTHDQGLYFKDDECGRIG